MKIFIILALVASVIGDIKGNFLILQLFLFLLSLMYYKQHGCLESQEKPTENYRSIKPDVDKEPPPHNNTNYQPSNNKTGSHGNKTNYVSHEHPTPTYPTPAPAPKPVRYKMTAQGVKFNFRRPGHRQA